MDIEVICRVCHEANRALCEALGDFSQPTWDVAPQWQKDSTLAGVRWRLDNRSAPAGAQHDQWVEEKIASGWIYGPVKDAQAKTHPLLVPYDNLPAGDKAKDALFLHIVLALR